MITLEFHPRSLGRGVKKPQHYTEVEQLGLESREAYFLLLSLFSLFLLPLIYSWLKIVKGTLWGFIGCMG